MQLPKSLLGPTAAAVVRRHFGIQVADRGVRGHSQHVTLAQMVQFPAKPGRTAHFVVSGNPSVRQNASLGFQHFQHQLMPSLIAKLLGNPTGFATATILRPFSRNIQPHIDQCVFGPRNVAHKDSHLATLDFPQTSAPLPRHGRRVSAFLREGRRIENDHAIRLSQCRSHLARQFLQQGLIIPMGRAEKCLQSLSIFIVAIGDCLSVFSFHVRQQTSQIALGMFPLFRPSQPSCKWFGKPVQAVHHSIKHGRMHMAIGQQLFLTQLKTSFHRLSPSFNRSVRKVLIQNDLRLVNTV